MPTLLNVGQRQAYERDGYSIIPNFFDTEKIGYLRTTMETDEQIHSHFYDIKDETGAPTKMAYGTILATAHTAWPLAQTTWLIPWKIYWVAKFTITTQNSQQKSLSRLGLGNGVKIMVIGMLMAAYSP